MVDLDPDNTFKAALANLRRFPTLTAHHVSLEAFPSRLMTSLTVAQAKVELQRLRRSKDKKDQEEIVKFASSALLAFHQLKATIETGDVPSYGKGKAGKSPAESPTCGGQLDHSDVYFATKFQIYEAFMLPLLDLAEAYQSTRSPDRRRAIKDQALSIVRKALFPPARSKKFFPPFDFVQHYDELVRCLHEILGMYRQRVRDKRISFSRRSGEAVKTMLCQEYPFFKSEEWDRIASNFGRHSDQASEIAQEILANRYHVHASTVRKNVYRLRKKSSHPR